MRNKLAARLIEKNIEQINAVKVNEEHMLEKLMRCNPSDDERAALEKQLEDTGATLDKLAEETAQLVVNLTRS
jgi:hypothetical protein